MTDGSASLSPATQAQPGHPTSFRRLYDLWRQFAQRAIETKHRGSYLGVFWALLNPLLMLALYVTVFGFIFKTRFNTSHAMPEYALAVFAGLILFHLISETVASAPNFIVSNPNFVKKVVFPLEVLPVANVSALCFHFGISLVLLLVAKLILSHSLSLVGLLWLPVILLPHLLLALGLALFLSALGVFLRDITQVIGFCVQVLLYASGVFYTTDHLITLSPGLWAVLRWNPLVHTIDLLRRALLWNEPLTLQPIVYIWLFGLAAFAFGLWFFRKMKPGFADVI